MFFFIKSNNPRPTFHLDMKAEERAVMQRHIEYWSEKAARGIAVVFGPVMDPQGVYGIGVYQGYRRGRDAPAARRRSGEGVADLPGAADASCDRRVAGRGVSAAAARARIEG
jgi:hypothetical protein